MEAKVYFWGKNFLAVRWEEVWFRTPTSRWSYIGDLSGAAVTRVSEDALQFASVKYARIRGQSFKIPEKSQWMQ